MADGYKKETAEALVAHCIKEIEESKKSVKKNFDEMDFENSVVRDDYEKIISEITSEYDSLINKISDYRFN